METILSISISIAVAIGFAVGLSWVWLRRRGLGSLEVTTAMVAYDHEAHSSILTWDKHCFYIHGNPVQLLSGEFHYWRLPDRSRWPSVLRQYKAAGLNCVRIYFHWGFHSPSQGVYLYDGNKDVDYLLRLCEDLRLYVLAAPGPYICAETQAGGIPAWLTARRDVRIRHSLVSMFRQFDSQYADFCDEWLKSILSVLKSHQVTTNPRGCLLAVQIENESFELFKGIPLGLSDDMKRLSITARQAGISVPLFTNDAWEEGSFIARDASHTVLGKPSFGLDLYGFDKYVVFCPTSAPLATIGGSATASSNWGEWKTTDVTTAFDKTEETVRRFGGGAASSPIFIPELQGGWFNHYSVPHTFDDVYSYYGESYTRMILDSAVSQGSTALSFYMFYGGTNWGALGDPDVYTSYDYSACIREFGHLSGRGRQLRLGFAFLRSFSDLICRTVPEDKEMRISSVIESSLPNFIAKRRRTIAPGATDFVFYRNFAPDKAFDSVISLKRPNKPLLQLKCRVPYKQSFIGLANYTVSCSGLNLLLSTLPIHLRIRPTEGQEVWIIQCDDLFNGQLAFSGAVEVQEGNTLGASVDIKGGINESIVSFSKAYGWTQIKQVGSSAPALIVVALTQRDLATMQPAFEDSYWRSNTKQLAGLNEKHPSLPIAVFWGCYGAHYDAVEKKLFLEQDDADKHLFFVSSADVSLKGFGKPTSDEPLKGAPFISKKDIKSHPELYAATLANGAIDMKPGTMRHVLFDAMPWKPLMHRRGKPSINAIDCCFTSGHVVYKLEWDASEKPSEGLSLKLNVRHRATLYLNGNLLGGHLVYSLGALRPGAKNGPDINMLGSKSYELPESMLKSGVNTLIVLVESFGLNRQPFILNDVRNPRGILEATLKGLKSKKEITDSIRMAITGVDVRELHDVFNSSGFPTGTSAPIPYEPKNNKFVVPSAPQILPTWFESSFDLPEEFQDVKSLRIPLRMHVIGIETCYIFINDVMISRYYGNGDCPQKHFYVPEGLVKPTDNAFKMIVYSTACLSSISYYNATGITVALKTWNMDQRNSHGISSGNLDENGKPFIIFNEVIESI